MKLAKCSCADRKIRAAPALLAVTGLNLDDAGNRLIASQCVAPDSGRGEKLEEREWSGKGRGGGRDRARARRRQLRAPQPRWSRLQGPRPLPERVAARQGRLRAGRRRPD